MVKFDCRVYEQVFKRKMQKQIAFYLIPEHYWSLLLQSLRIFLSIHFHMHFFLILILIQSCTEALSIRLQSGANVLAQHYCLLKTEILPGSCEPLSSLNVIFPCPSATVLATVLILFCIIAANKYRKKRENPQQMKNIEIMQFLLQNQ